MPQRILPADLQASVDAMAAYLDGGTLEFYTGPVPATIAAAPGGATLLATTGFANPAFAASTYLAGVAAATANPLVPATFPVIATGTVAFAIGRDSLAAVRRLFVAGEDFSVNVLNWEAGATVTVTSITIRQKDDCRDS